MHTMGCDLRLLKEVFYQGAVALQDVLGLPYNIEEEEFWLDKIVLAWFQALVDEKIVDRVNKERDCGMYKYIDRLDDSEHIRKMDTTDPQLVEFNRLPGALTNPKEIEGLYAILPTHTPPSPRAGTDSQYIVSVSLSRAVKRAFEHYCHQNGETTGESLARMIEDLLSRQRINLDDFEDDLLF